LQEPQYIFYLLSFNHNCNHWRQYGTQPNSVNRRTGECIKKIALSRHLSIAELIRQAVDTIIKSNVIIDTEERRKRALDVVDRFSSGKHDISKEHDKYLAEALGK
jgi:hypothetical protein